MRRLSLLIGHVAAGRGASELTSLASFPKSTLIPVIEDEEELYEAPYPVKKSRQVCNGSLDVAMAGRQLYSAEVGLSL